MKKTTCPSPESSSSKTDDFIVKGVLHFSTVEVIWIKWKNVKVVKHKTKYLKTDKAKSVC